MGFLRSVRCLVVDGDFVKGFCGFVGGDVLTVLVGC